VVVPHVYWVSGHDESPKKILKARALVPNDNNAPKAPETATPQPADAVSERATNNLKNDETKSSTNGAGQKSAKRHGFCPGEHGLMIKLIGHRDGQPVEAIDKLYASLVERFGLDDPIVALMIELAAVDYWRLGQGQLAEKRLIDGGRYVFEPKGLMPTIMRYNTVARRNLEKTVQFLQEHAPEGEGKPTGSEETPETSTDHSSAQANDSDDPSTELRM
jgi:hypothetical protein